MKQVLYDNLVKQRKECRKCIGMKNPGESGFLESDSSEIGPWSLLAGDLDARIMIVGQDWGDVNYYLSNNGRPSAKNPTNQNLGILLEEAGIRNVFPEGRVEDSGVFLTNAVLCLKESFGPKGGGSGMQRKVQNEWFSNCGKRFLRPQIDLVNPTVVVGLGKLAYEAILKAYGIHPEKFSESVDSMAGVKLPNGVLALPVYHCGRRSLNMNRSLSLQKSDWIKIGTRLREYS